MIFKKINSEEEEEKSCGKSDQLLTELKNRLENTKVKKTYNNPQEVEQGVASGEIKRGDVVQVGNIKSIYTGTPANAPNAFMDMEIINQRQMPKLLRVKQGSDGTMYEYYNPSY